MENKWLKAQNSEKEYWLETIDKKITNQGIQTSFTSFEYDNRNYIEAAGLISTRSKKHINISKNSKILQIGPAAYDVIYCLSDGIRYSLEPLSSAFKNHFENIDYSDCHLINAFGEHIPFKTNSFDLIIFTNVLDHVSTPELLLKEVQRILHPSGIVYFQVNTHPFLTWFSRKSANWLGIDKKHPHVFSPKSLENIVTSCGFDIADRFVHSAKEQREIMRKNDNPNIKLFGYLGLTIFSYNLILRKNDRLIKND